MVVVQNEYSVLVHLQYKDTVVVQNEYSVLDHLQYTDMEIELILDLMHYSTLMVS